jgi:hypothetical protein
VKAIDVCRKGQYSIHFIQVKCLTIVIQDVAMLLVIDQGVEIEAAVAEEEEETMKLIASSL